MNLSDELAVQRTQLANERTWLAYVRTALTLFVAGVSFIQFFSLAIVHVLGWLFIPLSGITVMVGWRRYRRACRVMKTLDKNTR